ncbi:NAD(P)/FAD-dependent oxidoreductase [Streptomyces sp. NPDC003032]
MRQPRQGNADVAVVGTGVIGLATAWEAVRRGLSVRLIGPRRGEHRGQASRAAGAMLAPFSEVAASDSPRRVALEVGERVAARDLYDSWLPLLRQESGRSLTLTPGLWVVATTGGRGDAAELDAIADAALTHGHRAERHDPGDVPGLSPARSCTARGALWLPGEATIDSGELMGALTDILQAHTAVTWTETEATGLRPSGGESLVITCADASEVSAERTVLTVGVGLTGLLAGSPELDLSLPPMLAGKGVSVLLRNVPFALPAAVRTPMRDFACGMHLVPRADGMLYVGATNRLSAPGTTPHPCYPSVMELTDLLRGAGEELNTKLYEGEIVGTRVGYRPFTLDHLPLVGPTADPRVLIASATYRNGILLAPRLAEMIADHLTSGTHTVAEHPFDPTRTPAPSVLPETLERHLSDVVDLLLPAHGAATGNEELLVGLLHHGLRDLAADPSDPRGAAALHTWQQAPVPEGLFAVLIDYLRTERR